MRLICALLLTGILAVLADTACFAAGHPARVALVIGNANYPDNDSALNDAANDARDVALELTRDGFAVEKGIDLSGEAMRQALDRFYARIERGAIALLFFDGFGIQTTTRQTFLLPVDAQIWAEADVAHDGLNLETILDQMNSRGAAVKIALLDASRRNPFERRFRRYSAGLAPAVTPSETLVLYSTAVGTVVSNSRNDHSLFVTELLKEIRAPGINAEQALRNTQLGVSSATNGEQIPWLSSSLTSEFSFSGGPIHPFDGGKDQSDNEKNKPSCEAPRPPETPAAEDLANDPRIKEMSRRIAADRNDGIAYYKRGQVYAIKGAYALAAQDFGNAIRLNAADADSYNNRCWTRAALGDLQAALQDCNMALQLDPGLAVALDSRGLVNLKLGNYAAAIRDYSQSIERNPRSVSSLFGRGVATRRSGGDGSADLSLAKSMDPNITREYAGYGISECAP